MTRDELESVSDELRVHLLQPRRVAPAATVDGQGVDRHAVDARPVVVRSTNAACGDELELHGRVEAGRLDLQFRAQGCWGVVATASLLCEALSGLTPCAARAHDHAAALVAAGGLPRARQHAVALFTRVLEDLLDRLPAAD